MDMMLQVLAPELLILIAAMTLLVGDTFWGHRHKALTFQLTLASIVVTALVILASFSTTSVQLFNGAFIRDGVADVLKLSMLFMTFCLSIRT